VLVLCSPSTGNSDFVTVKQAQQNVIDRHRGTNCFSACLFPKEIHESIRASLPFASSVSHWPTPATSQSNREYAEKRIASCYATDLIVKAAYLNRFMMEESAFFIQGRRQICARPLMQSTRSALDCTVLTANSFPSDADN